MCNTHNLLAYLCELFEYEKVPFALCAHLHGYEKAKQTVFARRMMMYSIAGVMIIDGNY